MVNSIFSIYNTITKGGGIMAVSEAQKKASNKYNLEHMATLGCKVRKEDAEAFKQYCSEHGKTPNTELKEHVLHCIGKSVKQE